MDRKQGGTPPTGFTREDAATDAQTRTVIAVEGLTAAYEDDIILDNISFRIGEGEIFLILGESGCGKSTLMKCMIGLHKPREGRIRVDGTDITDAYEEDVQKMRKGIGMLFQNSALLGSMTLLENVVLPLRRLGNLSDDLMNRIARMKLGMVNLSGYEHYYPSEVSGGMRNRAGLARAMALEPSILFLDEPIAGLDPVTAAEIDFLIHKINGRLGTTMVIITQNLESIFNLAHRCIMIDKAEKRIIAEGDPRELRDHSRDERVVSFFRRMPLQS